MSVLRSASVPGSSVKRVVYVSSLAAVVNSRPEKPIVHTEADWNELDPAEVQAKGEAASPISMYRTSKLLAEKAAWKLYREGREKGTIGWDLVTLCPPWTFGPALSATTPADLTASVGTWFSICIKEEDNPNLWSNGGCVLNNVFPDQNTILTGVAGAGATYAISLPRLFSPSPNRKLVVSDS